MAELRPTTNRARIGQTVEVHRLHIKDKLELTDAPSLVRHAVRWVETQRVE